ncbi:MAG: hypothetical protein ACK5Y2_14275 [Bdellovibrionales bacterium]
MRIQRIYYLGFLVLLLSFQNCSEVSFHQPETPTPSSLDTFSRPTASCSPANLQSGVTEETCETQIDYQAADVQVCQSLTPDIANCQWQSALAQGFQAQPAVPPPGSQVPQGESSRPQSRFARKLVPTCAAPGESRNRYVWFRDSKGQVSDQVITTCFAPPSSCTFNGLTVANGASVIAYPVSSVPFGQTCPSQQRTCANGLLSGSFAFASCSVGQPQACLFNGQTIPHNQSVTAYQMSSVPAGQTCQFQTRVCSNGVLSGSFAFSSCSVGQFQSCLFNGQTIGHGLSVTAFQTSSVPFGQTCSSESRTCNNGLLSGSFSFASCNAGQPQSCLFNGQTIVHGQSVTAFPVSSVPFGQSCQPETRTCLNGVLSGSAPFASCTSNQPQSCLFNGQTVAHGQTINAFQSPTVPSGQTCVSEPRTCVNGALTGSFTAPSCVVQAPQCQLLHPIGWDGEIAQGSFVSCAEYFRAPGSTDPVQVTFHNVGEVMTFHGVFCPFGGACNGQIVYRCELINGVPTAVIQPEQTFCRSGFAQ